MWRVQVSTQEVCEGVCLRPILLPRARGRTLCCYP
uniref:Uncharacterized protein n=1 Tax=Arundo donax TaxID=35708 RepID=A0A0A8ZDP9_ARUDO